MGKRGRRSGAKSAVCASSACDTSDKCPYHVWRSGGDGSLSSGLGLGSTFGLTAGAEAGAGVTEDFGSGLGASRTTVLVKSARVNHVGKRGCGGVELSIANKVNAAENETARTRAVRRRRALGRSG
jgi:hypothetical protein